MKRRVIDEQAALTFAEENTSHVEREVNEMQYPDIQYPFLIPVDNSAPDFAKTVTTYTSDKFGKADWINGNSDDIPLAGTEMGKQQTQVYMAAIGYGWGYEEINQASMMGYDLPADDAMAARRAYEEFVDTTSLRGDARKGMQGLINHTGITASAVVNGDWANAATADNILADINDILVAVEESSLYTASADTLLMSPAKLSFLATKRLGDTQMTLLKFLKENNVYTQTTGSPLTIRGVRGLETAGAGSTQRMIAYRRSPDVLKLHMPMLHTFLPIQRVAPLRYEVAGVFRMGGLDVRRPKEMRYADGI